METLQERLQREAREKLDSIFFYDYELSEGFERPVGSEPATRKEVNAEHLGDVFALVREAKDYTDTLISHTISETLKEAVGVIEGEKGKWVASYMPATDGNDPSKWGFDTEQEAWDWIEKRLTPCPLDPKDTSGKPCDSCMAEWMVYQIPEIDQALSTAITAVNGLGDKK